MNEWTKEASEKQTMTTTRAGGETNQANTSSRKIVGPMKFSPTTFKKYTVHTHAEGKRDRYRHTIIYF